MAHKDIFKNGIVVIHFKTEDGIDVFRIPMFPFVSSQRRTLDPPRNRICKRNNESFATPDRIRVPVYHLCRPNKGVLPIYGAIRVRNLAHAIKLVPVFSFRHWTRFTSRTLAW